MYNWWKNNTNTKFIFTCENFVLSAKVNCHRFNVPLECLVTIDNVGDGGAERRSWREEEPLPLPDSPPVEPGATGCNCMLASCCCVPSLLSASWSSSMTLGKGVVWSPMSLPGPASNTNHIRKRKPKHFSIWENHNYSTLPSIRGLFGKNPTLGYSLEYKSATYPHQAAHRYHSSADSCMLLCLLLGVLSPIRGWLP